MAEKSSAEEISKALIANAALRVPQRSGQIVRRPDYAAAPSISIQFVWHVVRRWWKVAAPVGLLLAASVVLVCYLLYEPKYEAYSLFRIAEVGEAVVDQPERSSMRYVETQKQLIKSPLVLGPALVAPVMKWDPQQERWVEQPGQNVGSLPDLAEREAPIEWLQEQIRVEGVGQSELYRISFSSAAPEAAACIVNAVTNAYFSLRDQEDTRRFQRVLELLDEEANRRREEITVLRGDIGKLTEELNPATARPSTAETILNDPLAGLPSRLTSVEVEKQVLQAKIESLQELLQKPTEVPAAMVAQAVQEHAEVIRARGEIAAKFAKLQEIKEKSVYGERDPAYVRLAAEIERDGRALKELQQRLGEQYVEGLRLSKKLSQEQELNELQAQLRSYDKMAAWLREKLESQVKQAKQDNVESLDLEFKRAELARAEQFHKLISDRAERIRVEGRAQSRVSLLAPAPIPIKPVELLPYKPLSLGVLAALVFPFGIAVLWERTLVRIHSADNLEQISRLNVIGEIASLPARRRVSVSSTSKRIGQDLRVFEESVDSLRTSLVLSEDLKDMKVLAVTSAANNEGKTSVASQLAVSLARASGEPALLIDGDMRSPDIQDVFEIPLTPGLAEVLAGECEIEQAIVTSWSKHVHLLPAGRLKTSPHKLLGNGKMRSLVQKTLASYRYVVIDTPPVLAASEALVLAKSADASILCAMRDVSRGDQVRQACDRLAAAGTHTIGTVLNGVPTKQYAYRYGSYAYVRQ